VLTGDELDELRSVMLAVTFVEAVEGDAQLVVRFGDTEVACLLFAGVVYPFK
jgi:exosome complex RNA-binding protein Rrp42 (RNase PH superfamily)